MTSHSDEISKQEEFVMRTLEERNIRFVRLWFTDVLGFLKSVAIAPAELENAFQEGIGFDGSSIEGFARITEVSQFFHGAPQIQAPQKCSAISQCQMEVRLQQIHEMY
jgi:glutamine synthetase